MSIIIWLGDCYHLPKEATDIFLQIHHLINYGISFQ
jgi:hypothetical protein